MTQGFPAHPETGRSFVAQSETAGACSLPPPLLALATVVAPGGISASDGAGLGHWRLRDE
jgi:hypothetical protein